MSRGQPDYGLYTETPVASGISDPGEAAARLGSINVYDRRGWTVWMDDFEAPSLKWTSRSSVGGTLPVLSTADAWMGIQCAYFRTAIVAGAYAEIRRKFPLIRQGKVGIEFTILNASRALGYFRARILTYDGVNRTDAELRLDANARTATIVTPAGDIIVATNCFNTLPHLLWRPVKLVVDTSTDHYIRLLIGPTEIDISSHQLVPAGASNETMLWVDLRLVGELVFGQNAYLDNFIMTQNEP